MIEDLALRVSPQDAADIDALKKIVAAEKRISCEDINDIKIIRRSVDARQKNIKINIGVRIAVGEDSKVSPFYAPVKFEHLPKDASPIIIIGAGPAGLFAALKAIELGLKPIVLERGKDVDQRRIDLAAISRTGKVNPVSNYCFGEGGAGAYSDGKLFTRSKKRGNVTTILELLHQHGADESILIDSHPHIGSDKLPMVIKNIRNKIIECGGEVHFETQVTDILIKDSTAVGVITKNGTQYDGPVVLATGHSARDIYKMLYSKDISLKAKPLAIGVRLEHPQDLIDRLQYHNKEGRGKYLPAAEYSFVTQVDGRGVYSFCMCPGGVVVPAMSGENEFVVNGMSASGRSSRWANSGMVVEVHPGDIKGYEDRPLDMLRLQEDLESKFFFQGEAENLNSPAQKMTDFVNGVETSTPLPKSSYPAGIHSARIDLLLPPEISSRLKEGFTVFNKKCKGFLTDKAILLGLESRTSSPIRIPRDKDTLSHIEIEDLYPAGEGAGYAGGIVSAAIDGQKCVEAYYEKNKKSKNG